MRKMTIFLFVLSLVLVGTLPAEAGWEEGVAAYKAGNYTQAAKEFQTVVQEKPEWGGGHYMLGQALQKLNRDEEALTHLRKAYDLDPNDISRQMLLAKAYLDNRRYNDAANLLSKINPSSLPKSQQGYYHQMTSVAYSKSGQSSKAIASLKQAADSNPSSADAQYNYGVAAFNAGQEQAGLAAIEKALRLDPNDNEKKATYVKVLIRNARTASGSAKIAAYKKAAPAAQQLANASPTFDNLLTLGEVHLGAKDYNAAATAFQKAVAKNGNDWLAHYYLGQAQTSLGRYPQAETSLRTALERTSDAKNERTIWGQIGFVNEKLKNYDEAKEAYRKAGQSGAIARVEENERIAAENQDIEAENARIREMEEERKRLEEELKELPGGRPPR